MRVRNIFICSGVVFCASSRMMKLLLSVRPRMNASGATSTVPRSSSFCATLRVDHVVQGVVERAQVRVDLRHQVAGQEAEPLARFDGRPGEDDPLHLACLQRLHGHGDRQPRLAGAGRPDAERDDVVADRLDVALLASGLRPDVATLGAPQHLVRQHLGRPLVGAHHADRPVDRAFVELVSALEQADQLFEQSRHLLGVGPRDGDLVPRTVTVVSGN